MTVAGSVDELYRRGMRVSASEAGVNRLPATAKAHHLAVGDADGNSPSFTAF